MMERQDRSRALALYQLAQRRFSMTTELDFNNMQDPVKPTSLLLSILPSVVTRRLPQLPSMRRSISLYTFGTVDEQNLLVWPTKEEAVESRDEDHISKRVVTTPDTIEISSGIDWKYGIQGLNLLTSSVNDASRIEPVSAEPALNFTRQLYIHSLSYLLRGLPSTLSPEEILCLQTALPPSLPTTKNPRSQEVSVHGPSIFHRSLSSLIVFLFLLSSVLLPYVRILVRKIHECEQQHHIAERVLHGGVGVVDEMSRKGLNVSAAIWGIGVGEGVGWVLEEIGGGVREGVREGVGRFKQRGMES